MKKILVIIVWMCTLPTCMWAEVPVHRLGSYNIRYSNNSDKEEKSWDNRKTYLANLIKQIDYDVVGLQEVMPTQFNDLVTLLPEYTIYCWGRGSATVSTVGEGVAVAYKTSKYTCLDQGRFFIGPNTESATKAWDAAMVRISVWVKLQDKTTGEVFLFCSTHLDNTGAKARIEGARVNCEQVLSKVPGNYPIILVGDMNAGQAEKGVHYQYGSSFMDSRKVSQTTPVGQEGTMSNWKTSSNSNRIDYIYVRNLDVKDYTLSNEDFSRGVTPSDHYPIYITARFMSPQRATTNTVNNISELKQAVAASVLGDTIYLNAGEYALTEELTIPQTLTMIGKGDVSITSNRLHAVAPAYLHLENIHFTAIQSSDKSCFGAAISAEGYGLEMTNCQIAKSKTDGKGLVYSVGRTELKHCVFSSLESNEDAGPVYLASMGYWPLSIEDCVFSDNQGLIGSAIYITGLHEAFISRTSFVRNTSMMAGALTYYDSGNTPSILMVNSTFANNIHRSYSSFINVAYGGAAIYLMGTKSAMCNLVHCTVVGNVSECLEPDGTPGAGFTGGALCSYSGQFGLYNNLILANYANNAIGDVALTAEGAVSKDQYNVFTSASNCGFSVAGTDFLSANYTTGLQQALSLLGGTITDTYYTAPLCSLGVYDLPVVAPIAHAYNAQNIECISIDQRSENILQLDLNNDGKLDWTLDEDQARDIRSVFGPTIIGATLEHQPTALPSVNPSSTSPLRKKMCNGTLWIETADKCYTILGNKTTKR